jgi:hypothetical protein
LSIFNIIILTKRNGKCSDVLKCSKNIKKPVLHTAFITTLIYIEWCAPYLNVHKKIQMLLL